jgi:hypothetical protein
MNTKNSPLRDVSMHAQLRATEAVRRILSLSIVFGILLFAMGCGSGGGTNNSSGAPAAHTVGGTVSGLAGAGLVLQDDGGNNLTMLANGSFTFTTPVARPITSRF